MYNLIRFYNQNRKKIFKIILIIVLIIGLIQLFNYFAKISSKNKYKKEEKSNNTEEYKQLNSDKSLVSGENITNKKTQKDLNIINEFIEYCNNKNIDLAYNLLTEECKEVMFPTVQDFYNIYYLDIFNNGNKTYTVDNWNGNVYQIRYSEDILASGNLQTENIKQDYITVQKYNDETRLNINNYIERKNVNKLTEYKDVKIKVKSIDVYMDYEIYNLNVENNSQNTILLDTSDDVQSIYLLDGKNMKYEFYGNEIVKNKLIVKSKFANDLSIKFNCSYSSNRKIKNLVFSKLVLNYDEYQQVQDKNEFEGFFRFGVNI